MSHVSRPRLAWSSFSKTVLCYDGYPHTGPQRRVPYRGQPWPQPDRSSLPHRRAGAEQARPKPVPQQRWLAEVDERCSGPHQARLCQLGHLPAGPVARLARWRTGDVNAPRISDALPLHAGLYVPGALWLRVCARRPCAANWSPKRDPRAIPRRWLPIQLRRSTPPATARPAGRHCATNSPGAGLPAPRAYYAPSKRAQSARFMFPMSVHGLYTCHQPALGQTTPSLRPPGSVWLARVEPRPVASSTCPPCLPALMLQGWAIPGHWQLGEARAKLAHALQPDVLVTALVVKHGGHPVCPASGALLRGRTGLVHPVGAPWTWMRGTDAGLLQLAARHASPSSATARRLIAGLPMCPSAWVGDKGDLAHHGPTSVPETR